MSVVVAANPIQAAAVSAEILKSRLSLSPQRWSRRLLRGALGASASSAGLLKGAARVTF
jgi:hypothetical protein